MGLDLVELVMSFEEEFGIEIPDSIAEKIVTVGDAVDIVTAGLMELGRPADPTDIFERIRRLTAERAEVPPERVTREARFIQDLGMD